MKRYSRLLLLCITVLGLTATASGLESYLVKAGPEAVSGLKYEIGPPSTNAYYQDALGKNPDIGAMICRSDGSLPSQKHVGLTYSLNRSGSPVYSLVSYEAGNSKLPSTSTEVTFNSKDCLRTSLGGFVVSPSEFADRNPEVNIAAHPGNFSLLVSNSSDGSDPSFINIEGVANGSFNGESLYNHDSNEIDFTIHNITVESHSGSFNYDPAASDRGISSKRPLVVGFCLDAEGDKCPKGSVVNSDSFPSYSFDVSKSEVNDQRTYTRYGVVNGFVFDRLEIGADLNVSSLQIKNKSIYYSENQKINFTVTNNGNVPVTSGFTVNVTVEDESGDVVYNKVFGVTGTVPENGGSFQETVEWNAKAESGNYTVKIEPDSQNDISEVNENSLRSESFELEAVAVPEIRVDGVEKNMTDDEFLSAGVPYNFTLIAENSDGEAFSNSSFTVVEEDATSSFAPSQMYKLSTGSGTENYSIGVRNEVDLLTDKNGRASITLTPTGNILLKDEFSYLEIQDRINYSIYLEGEDYRGEKIMFLVGGEVKEKYKMSIKDESRYELPSGDEYKDLPNIESYASTTMNTVHSIFSNFWEVAQ